MNTCDTCKHSGEAYSFRHEPLVQEYLITLLPCEHPERKNIMKGDFPGVVFSFQTCWRWEKADG